MLELVERDRRRPPAGQLRAQSRAGLRRRRVPSRRRRHRPTLLAHHRPRPDAAAVEVERAFLAELGSGCSLPVGAHAADGEPDRLPRRRGRRPPHRSSRSSSPSDHDARRAHAAPNLPDRCTTGCNELAGRAHCRRSPEPAIRPRQPRELVRLIRCDTDPRPADRDRRRADRDGRARTLELAKIDWIVVTSPNGAQRVAPLLHASSSSPRLAAVGSATAAALPRCDLVADTQSALGLLEVFPSGTRPSRRRAGGRCRADACLRPDRERLGRRRHQPLPHGTTSRRRPTSNDAALAADAVLFASGSAARAWAATFGRRTPPVVVAIGEQTAAAADARRTQDFSHFCRSFDVRDVGHARQVFLRVELASRTRLGRRKWYGAR